MAPPDLLVLGTDNLPVGARWSNAATRGVYKEHLRGLALYEALGRPDMAARFRRRSTVRTAFLGTGIAVAAAGFIGMAGSTAMHNYRGYYRQPWGAIGAGGIAVTAGTGISMAALFANRHPAKPAAIRRMAAEHNARLATQLGLTHDEAREAIEAGALLD